MLKIFDKRRKDEDRRQRKLSEIRGTKSTLEAMVKRAEINGSVPDEYVRDIQRRLEAVEGKATRAGLDELDDLVDEADSLGQLRAYFCPDTEIPAEARLLINVVEEWGAPRPAIAKLRDLLDRKFDDPDPKVRRGALRALYEEYDDWAEYTDDYNETMNRYTQYLLWAIGGLLLLAILFLNFPRTVLLGLLLAGGVGGCVSVVSKLPALGLSGEFDAYGRHVLGRIGTGVVSSLVGCALLGWGVLPISIQNQSFADVLNACAVANSAACTGARILVLLGVAILFGFSERALMSFEGPLLGNSDRTKFRRPLVRGDDADRGKNVPDTFRRPTP